MSTLRILAASCVVATFAVGASAQTVGIVATAPGTLTHSYSTAVAKAVADKTKL